ncbi:putative phosphatidate phosphatase [Limulus polyphemus]|uniref:Phosphatidate phosphatase n=1 Tax=Limulus polyphemus TaxID=6850 RepID=A0ABM1B818_LIMPO|nr:putative phosphatidate phosphatase [Limulus polyphemus]
MQPEERKLYLRIIFDIVFLAIVGIPLLIFFFAATPYKRGFFCDDDSIRYPYKDSTISNVTLYCVGVLGPAIVMTVAEAVICKKYKLSYKQPKVICGFSISCFVWQVYRTVGVFAFGACISQLSTDIAKYSIGRLRPHFIDVCQPDMSLTDCNHSYITEYRCTGSDENKIREARLSFPSGHASFSAYSMVYLAIYIQYRLICAKNSLLKPFLQAAVLLAAWYTGLSRVVDHKHHWSDVLSGFLLGIIVSLLVVFFIADLKKPAAAFDDSRTFLTPDASNTYGGEVQLESQTN